MVIESKRCPSTKTLPTISPAPPTIGTLWQPAHELASGAEKRLKFRGNTKGEARSESGVGVPTPFASGLPWPSWTVQFAEKSCLPKSSRGVSDHEIVEWLNQNGEKKTAEEIKRWADEVEGSSLYHHPEKRDFFSEEVNKLGLDPSKTTTFEWLEVDDRVSHAQEAA